MSAPTANGQRLLLYGLDPMLSESRSLLLGTPVPEDLLCRVYNIGLPLCTGVCFILLRARRRALYAIGNLHKYDSAHA